MTAVTKEQRLLTVLRAPVISEKSTSIAESHNQVAFDVATDATKAEVKAAVELIWKVNVESVQILNRIGKEKRHGRFIGRRNHSRRAYVRLAAGQELNFGAEA
jgi:large subunit ribosomal protein L23